MKQGPLKWGMPGHNPYQTCNGWPLTGHQLSAEFRAIFDEQLGRFWHKWLGFDVVGFGKFVRPRIATKHESLAEAVERKWGFRAREVLMELVGESPILDRFERQTNAASAT